MTGFSDLLSISFVRSLKYRTRTAVPIRINGCMEKVKAPAGIRAMTSSAVLSLAFGMAPLAGHAVAVSEKAWR